MSTLPTTDLPHRRWNPLTGRWVLVSPHRALRPWQGQVEATTVPTMLAHDPSCYLCPGNARVGGVRNPDYTGPFVFDNDFPALLPNEGGLCRHDAHGLVVSETATGICRVVCFSPRHDLTLSQMTRADVRAVVDTWCHEVDALGHRPDIAYVQVFENRGAMMGCSNPHPHGQIWATNHVPDEPAAETLRQTAHLAAHGRTLLADYLAYEEGARSRVVFANDAVVVVVPFWAVWPFEVLAIARRPVAWLTDLTSDERDGWADALQRLTGLYDRVFDAPFPYSMGLHQAPYDDAPHPEWHLHLHAYPPLLRSATVRKFMVGYEMLGTPQRDMTPEAAAERLRAALL